MLLVESIAVLHEKGERPPTDRRCRSAPVALPAKSELLIGQNQYSVSFEAENTDDPYSFVTNDDAIQPGQTRTGTIDFDVPSIAAQQANEHGALIVTDFGESVDSAQTAGMLKLFQH